jgi:lipopolysaccharide/colanic/teichoic acid biosynthesis glycosyltransferase
MRCRRWPLRRWLPVEYDPATVNCAPAQMFGRRHAKRLLDLFGAGLCLLIMAPAMLLIAMLIRLTSPGPALFCQIRVGQHGRLFRMYKFRSMQDGCSDRLHREYVGRLMNEQPAVAGKNELYKLDGDPRVTRLGAVLRWTSFDELPQLFNVLKGDMSLVGPRPMLPWELEMLTPAQRQRLLVPAGITGLWQVSGRSRLTMKQAIDLDIEYVRRYNFLLDLRILLKTVLIFIVPRGGAL